MAYRAEIEIGVKGQQRIQRLSSEINKSAKAVDSLADSLGSRGVVSQSLSNFDKLLNRTKRTLDSVIAGTDAEKKAVKEYVTVLGQANSFQERQNKLIAEEIRQRNGATAALKKYNAAAVPGRQPGGSMAGRYLRPGQARGATQFGGPIGPGPASATALSSRLPASSRFFGGTQYSGPIGPGPVSPTALSSRLPASSRFFGGTQYSGPIGPGPASSIFGGQSSAVEGRIKRILAIKKDELQLERALIRLQQKSNGLDTESIKENNRLLNLKADEVARNNEIIRQERVKQSILRKRQRLEAAGRTPGGGRRGRRGGQRFTDIATGAGFPLLFGGGPLQALAGGVGGAFGGLGGAIGASAVVAQIEAFATAAAQTGVALTSTSGALELMREKSLFSSEAAKERAAVLEELGQVEELAAHLGQEMANAIGNNGVKALQDLGDTTKETTRLWNLLTTQLFRLVAGPLDAFLKAINQVLGGITTGQQFATRREELGAEGAAALDARVAELVRGDVSGLSKRQINRGVRGVGAMSLVEARKQALSEEQFQIAAAPLPVTDEDRRKFSVKGKKDRLPSLNVELGLKERLLVLNKEIAQAVLDGDKANQVLLEKEKVREELAGQIDKIKTKGLTADVQAKEIAIARVDAAQKIQNIDTKTAQAKADQIKKGQETLDGLLAEQNLLQATLDGRKEEEEITQRVNELKKQNPTLSEEELRGILETNAGLKEKIRLMKEAEAFAKQISTTIRDGLVDGIMAAVDGTRSLSESLSGILRQLGQMFLSKGIGNFSKDGKGGSGLLGLLPFADGGRPPVGRPSIVGERGPELFVPRSSGTIIPNHQLGGGTTNVVVNVDAQGTAAQGNDAQANQLGRVIGAAVQAELIKQKRPGGLLTR